MKIPFLLKFLKLILSKLSRNYYHFGSLRLHGTAKLYIKDIKNCTRVKSFGSKHVCMILQVQISFVDVISYIERPNWEDDIAPSISHTVQKLKSRKRLSVSFLRVLTLSLMEISKCGHISFL